MVALHDSLPGPDANDFCMGEACATERARDYYMGFIEGVKGYL
jgi:hypothetical protein